MTSIHVKLQNRSTLLAVACALFLGFSAPGAAQVTPNDSAQEAIIKRSLLTFNDANLSGNYVVMNALASKPFRDSLSPEKLKDAFKVFVEKGLDISGVITAKAVVTKPTSVDADGVMVTEGYFDTPKMRVIYSLKHLLSDGQWKILGINVKTEDPPK